MKILKMYHIHLEALLIGPLILIRITCVKHFSKRRWKGAWVFSLNASTLLYSGIVGTLKSAQLASAGAGTIASPYQGKITGKQLVSLLCGTLLCSSYNPGKCLGSYELAFQQNPWFSINIVVIHQLCCCVSACLCANEVQPYKDSYRELAVKPKRYV